MSRAIKGVVLLILMGLGGLLGCQTTTDVEPEQDVLIHCRDVYCPGFVGMFSQDTPAKLAIIKIWHSGHARRQLLDLYPKCNGVGQAYVLAALWHFDQGEFGRLAAEFISDGKDKIPVASADLVWSQTREELVAQMQSKDSTLAFADPPLTRDEVAKILQRETEGYIAALGKTADWKKAAMDFELGEPGEGEVGLTMEIRPKITGAIPFTIEWGWQQQGGKWHASPSIEEVKQVIEEIHQTKFIQDINRQTKLDIYLEAVAGNFYDPTDASDAAPGGNELANVRKLLYCAGCSDTNKLIKVLARSDGGPLTLWHPSHSPVWLITWNLRISPQWQRDYETQTGLKLTDNETASGWVGACDNDGKLTMRRCPAAKSISERAQEALRKKAAPSNNH